MAENSKIEWTDHTFNPWNKEAEKSGKPARVFCASLADWLDSEVPVQWALDMANMRGWELDEADRREVPDKDLEATRRHANHVSEADFQ